MEIQVHQVLLDRRVMKVIQDHPVFPDDRVSGVQLVSLVPLAKREEQDQGDPLVLMVNQATKDHRVFRDSQGLWDHRDQEDQW